MSLSKMSFLPPAVSGENSSGRMRSFLLLFLQMTFSFVLLHLYHIEENNGLIILLPYLGISALINHWINRRWKPLYFILVCCALTWYALGMLSAMVAISGVLTFFALAHLEINRIIKFVLAFILIGVLFLVRIQYLYTPSMLTAVPIIGTFLMLRFILYAYEVRYETQSASLTERLSYFMNPVNIAFPLFPVIDYKTWLKALNQDAATVHAKSTRRILLGILQLLLYRWLYLHSPSAALIDSAGELAVHVFASFFMVLRILGIYWIAIGLVGYFGYSLPPVFENAFFITSFSEMWRKINIYWRDFVIKVFYYPIYFKLRKKLKRALLISSLCVFVITWLLHAWQWFWIRGDTNLGVTDAMYWILLGTFISINLVWEEKKKKVLRRETWRDAFNWMIRVAGVYTALSILWMLWQSATVGEFLYLSGKISVAPETLLPIGVIALLILIVGTIARYFLQKKEFSFTPAPVPMTVIAFVCCVILSLPVVLQNENKLPPVIASLYTDVKSPRLNTTDRENAEQGYYEMLADARNGSPWEQHANVHGRNQWFSESEIPVEDIRKRILQPSYRIEYEGMTFTTNRWGFRSPECELVPLANTLRVAVLGGSYEMGSGVSDEDVFMRVVEKMMNDSLTRSGSKTKIEVVNFATGAYQSPQFAYQCDSVIFDFNPHVVFIFAHSNDLQRLNSNMAGLIKNSSELHYDTLKKVKESLEVSQGMSRTEIKNRLQPANVPVLKWSYRYITRSCQAQKVPAYWIYLPTLNSGIGTGDYAELSGYAKAAGFYTLSLADVYQGQNELSLQISEEDYHPAATGHQIIATHLYHLLTIDEQFNSLISSQNNNP